MRYGVSVKRKFLNFAHCGSTGQFIARNRNQNILMTENYITTSKKSAPAIDENKLRSLIIDAIQDKKGHAISIVNLEGIESAPALEFIICEGRTPQQVAAIADSVRESLLEKAGIKPYNYDGYRNSQWIVIDYGSTMVHIFVPDARTLYNLEELWNDAVITEIPDLD